MSEPNKLKKHLIDRFEKTYAVLPAHEKKQVCYVITIPYTWEQIQLLRGINKQIALKKMVEMKLI